mmetsp:Transcript_33246/g.88981  ORF Transcript_33246/g.88981 Transcript_33246/m.88981 type:complete len:201 (+) Transcript_33246:881-1483(+)
MLTATSLGQIFAQRFTWNNNDSQKRVAKSAANLCSGVAARPVMTSFRRKRNSIQSKTVGADTLKFKANMRLRSSARMSSGNTSPLCGAPFKNTAVCFARSTKKLSPTSCRRSWHILTLMQSAAIPATTCCRTSRLVLHVPAASRIWTTQKKWSECSHVSSNVWRTKRSTSSRDAISDTVKVRTQDGSRIMLSSFDSIEAK